MKTFERSAIKNLWHVQLREGSVYDAYLYELKHLFFVGDNEEDVWENLCEYIDQNSNSYSYIIHDKKVQGEGGIENPMGLEYKDKKYISKNYKGGELPDSKYINVKITKVEIIK